MIITLRGIWHIACDPENRGHADLWFDNMPASAQPAPVPGIIQQVFPDYHGLVWYWTHFNLPVLPEEHNHWLLRFGAADYKTEVWVNGRLVGEHEGGETPFELDVTTDVVPGDNRVALRVLNPGLERIDGMVLGEIPHRHKIVPFRPGACYNYGGILLPVELAAVPPVRVSDIFAQTDWHDGTVQISVSVHNDTNKPLRGRLEAIISRQESGDMQAAVMTESEYMPGDSLHIMTANVRQPHLWSMDDPCLYLLAVNMTADEHRHRRTVRIGFRDFRIENGWFILNGRRLFLKSTHTGNHFPIGQVVPPTADLMRRDLIYAKACGYNCVRFIAGMAWPEQLEYCDEIGLMVYEECLAGWWGNYDMPTSETALRRFDHSVREMVLRDRNHPSVTIWGLLNETPDSKVFRRAVASLPWVRELDPSRLVLLGSGRWDCQPSVGSASNPGSTVWEPVWGAEAPDAPAVSTAWNTIAGGYFEKAGDAHTYPSVPQTKEAKDLIRNLGSAMKPVFLSEYGIGSLMDVIGEARKFEEAGCRADIHDCAAVHSMADRLETDWKQWGFEGTYPFAEDMLRDSQRLHMRQRRHCFDLVRANPQLCGYNLTGMLDHGLTGEGLWTYWRELKPLAADTLRDGWAPLRWCLSVTPGHGYAGQPIGLEAVLANEDVLPAGNYPVTFRITGAQGIVWEQSDIVVIPQPPAGEHGPLAIPVLNTTVRHDMPAGEYIFAARLDHGGAPAGDRTPFRLSNAPESYPQDARISVSTWGLDTNAESWLVTAGLQLKRFTDGLQRTPEVILVGKPEASARTEWVELARQIARGSVAVFLSPDALQRGDDSTFWLPLIRKGKCRRSNDWLYHMECVAKGHPIFDGLQAGGILDWDYYDQVIGHASFTGQDKPDEIICAAFGPCIGSEEDAFYSSGTMVASYRLGSGLFLLNTLNILDQVTSHPAADRLLLNLIRFAHKQRAARKRSLTADFGRILGEMYPL